MTEEANVEQNKQALTLSTTRAIVVTTWAAPTATTLIDAEWNTSALIAISHITCKTGVGYCWFLLWVFCWI